MRIAVLALQGAFIEHEEMLSKLGVASFEIRKKNDLMRSFDGLIIPGGESTVQGKLLKELDLLESIRQLILEGLPTFGTCAVSPPSETPTAGSSAVFIQRRV